MSKSLVIGLMAVLVLVVGTSASAANEKTSKSVKTRTATRFCVRYEFNHVMWTHGDLNAYRGNRRVCIVGKPGKNGKAGARGSQGVAGAVGATGATGAARARLVCPVLVDSLGSTARTASTACPV